MLGAYDAHFYCDVCGKFDEPTEVNNAGQARSQMRKRGWKLVASGHTICPTCPATAPLMPAEKQQGGEWQNYE